MTLTAGVLAALARAAVAALLAWRAAVVIDGYLSVQPAARGRHGVWLGLAALAVMPPLVISYAWANLLLAGPSSRAVAVLHTVLLGGKWLPAAVVALHFAPSPPLGPTGNHALELVAPGTNLARHRARLLWWRLLHGAGRRHVLAVLAVFLLAFQDFELSSLLMQPSWTVWLFDAQVGGLPLSITLARAVAPLTIEVAVLAAIGWILWTRGVAPRRAAAGQRAASGAHALAAVGVAMVVVIGLPVWFVFEDTLDGLGVVARDGSMRREIAISLALGAIATLMAMLASWSLLTRGHRGWLGAAALAVPGLCGGLVTALAVQALFTLPGLATFYDTPLPLLIAAVLWLLPLALVLTAVLGLAAPRADLHAARLLARGDDRQRVAAGRLLSALLGRKRLWAAGILFAAYYFEVVAAALLAPAAMTPAAVRLYNLMHYGHSDVLSAMVSLMLIVLFAVLGIAFAVRATWRRRGAHA